MVTTLPTRSPTALRADGGVLLARCTKIYVYTPLLEVGLCKGLVIQHFGVSGSGVKNGVTVYYNYNLHDSEVKQIIVKMSFSRVLRGQTRVGVQKRKTPPYALFLLFNFVFPR